MHEREAEPDPEAEEVAIFVAIKHPGIPPRGPRQPGGVVGREGGGKSRGESLAQTHAHPGAGEKRSGDLVWAFGGSDPLVGGLPGGGGKAERRNLPSAKQAASREGAHQPLTSAPSSPCRRRPRPRPWPLPCCAYALRAPARLQRVRVCLRRLTSLLHRTGPAPSCRHSRHRYAP